GLGVGLGGLGAAYAFAEEVHGGRLRLGDGGHAVGDGLVPVELDAFGVGCVGVAAFAGAGEGACRLEVDGAGDGVAVDAAAAAGDLGGEGPVGAGVVDEECSVGEVRGGAVPGADGH